MHVSAVGRLDTNNSNTIIMILVRIWLLLFSVSAVTCMSEWNDVDSDSNLKPLTDDSSDFYGFHFPSCRCRNSRTLLKMCFQGKGHCGSPSLDNCKKIVKNRCHCPRDRPIYRLSKCYRAFECPQIERDGLSDNHGHSFILTGIIDKNNVAYGDHLIIMRHPAHWYHALVKFKTDNECRKAAEAREAEVKGSRYVLDAVGPRKLLDLIHNATKGDVNMVLGTIVAGKLQILRKVCKILKVNLEDDHISGLSDGVTIDIKRPKGVQKPAVLKVGETYDFRLRDLCERYPYYSLQVEKLIVHDTRIISRICPK